MRVVVKVLMYCAVAVVVCATCEAAAEVAADLRAPGLLDHMLTLRPPGADDRAVLMSTALQSRGATFDAAQVQVGFVLHSRARLSDCPSALGCNISTSPARIDSCNCSDWYVFPRAVSIF